MNFFEKTEKEQEFQFNRSEIWLDLDDIDEEFEKSFKPHSKTFTNRLRPIWLYYVKKIQKLGFFDYVLSRDGALGLIRFFSKFPTPDGIRTKILIDEAHYRLVPLSWKNNVSLYSKQRKSTISKTNEFVIVLTGHELVITKSEMKEEIESIIKDVGPKKLYLCPVNLKTKGMTGVKQGESYLAELVSEIATSFDGEIVFISAKELTPLNLGGSGYHELNNRKCLFSESFLAYVLSSKGCINFKNKITEKDNLIQIGLHTFVEPERDWPSDYEKVRKVVESQDFTALLKNDREEELIPVCFNTELYSYSKWVNSI